MGVGLGIAITVFLVELPRFGRERSLAGAVVTADADPRKQLPVPNVEITAEASGTVARATSDSSGFFRAKWRSGIWRGSQVTLRFRHPDYQPLEITQPLTNQLYIARLTSSASVKDREPHQQDVSVADIRVRYAVKASTTINIGSTAKNLRGGQYRQRSLRPQVHPVRRMANGRPRLAPYRSTPAKARNFKMSESPVLQGLAPSRK